MIVRTLFSICILFTGINAMAQQPKSREDLERQRQQLKGEIEETEKALNANKTKTKENLLQYKLISNKVDLQDRVVDNISKEVRILDNDIYSIQKDINKYNRLLDTMRAEYARSMVYAYKNRGNYEFLNFIFSASSFNDAIKRVAYLKSFRNYQALQGDNILRTQELRKNRVADLSGSKKEKNEILKVQNKELKTLEQQKAEQNRVLAELKKQSKNMNNQIAAKKRQMQKVSNAIAAAIKKAQQEAIAKAAAEEKKRKEAEKKLLANAARPEKNSSSSDNNTKSVTAAPEKTTSKPRRPEGTSILLNSGNIALNNSFEKNRGSLPWPVDNGYVLMHYGLNKLPSESDITIPCVTIASEVGTTVKAVFDGTVYSVRDIEGTTMIIIQHGKYFTTYSNLSSASVSVGQEIKTGQPIGRVAANIDGVGAVDFFLSNEKVELNPETWLRRK